MSTASLRAQLTVALSLAAGAVIYLSDQDELPRHWRIAVFMLFAAALVLFRRPRLPARATPAHAMITWAPRRPHALECEI